MLSAGKWKLDILKRDHLVMNFRRSIVNAELWRPEVARFGKITNFCVFFEKQPLTCKLSKFCSNRIRSETNHLVVFKFSEFGRLEISEIVRCLPDKKFA